jgi:hypothetical protein
MNPKHPPGPPMDLAYKPRHLQLSRRNGKQTDGS